MNPFVLSPPERIRAWRDLRESIKEKTLEEAALDVSLWWWQAPIVQFTIDYDRPETWPTPWEMMYENEFDNTARAYMMAETLLLAGLVTEYDLEIVILNCKDLEEIKSLVLVEKRIILNYAYNSVNDTSVLSDGCYAISRLELSGKKWVSV